MVQTDFVFNGSKYNPAIDKQRLTKGIERVLNYLKINRNKWVTVAQVSKACGIPEASCSAQIRNLRKPVNGAHNIIGEYRGDRGHGIYYYMFKPNQ